MTEELGRTSSTTATARRVASAFGVVALLVVIVWLLRRDLGISSYSLDLLLAVFGFVFIGMVLRTEVQYGAVRAVSSLFLNLFGFCVITIVLIWILPWIDGHPLPGVLNNYVPALVIAGLVTIIAAYLIRQFAPKRGSIRAAGKPMLVHADTKLKLGAARITSVSDGIAVPLGQGEKQTSYVLFSDVQMALDTPMGTKEILLKSPVAISGIPLLASKTNEEKVRALTNKSSRELFVVARSALPDSQDFGTTTAVDLPFVHVTESGEEDVVEVGPIHVRSGPSGDHVKIGPLEFNDREDHKKRHDHDRWYAYSRTGASISSRFDRINAKWNGSSMIMRQDYMKLKSGSDGFEYDPQEIVTTSALHKLRVTHNNVSLETAQFTINVQEGKVVVREQDGKLKSSQSADLARDLKSVLSELAMKQVRDIIAGEPVDLGELLERTEEVLNRYE